MNTYAPPHLSRATLGVPRMAIAPTGIERRILDFMVEYLRSNTYQPSIREIGERFGIKSTKTVSEHLQALAQKGFLERDPSRSRGVRILGMDLNPDVVSLPCYRELPEGKELRPDRAESFLTLDRKLVPNRGAFVVRAGGEGLPALGVSEGDYLLVEPMVLELAEEGSVVVVREKEGASYRRVSRNGRGVHLHDLRPGHETLLVEDADAVDLVGRVSALIHRMDGRDATVSLTSH
jgi:repressor LexA